MSREKIGKFEIIRHLARGGMADVFLARVEGLEGFEKICVLKRMLPDLMASEEHVQMFLDEARIAGALHHANIVQVYDVGVADGKYFLAMEYLAGHDVSCLFRALGARGERMPFEQAVHIVASICGGLHHAHECRDPHGVPMGIVHRDISPQNVFVTFDGHVKVMDFGIAKASKRSTRTRSGVLKGKLGYMAPEQARGKHLDRRADIFAAAVILWELTTGRHLHPSRNEYEILKAIVERTPPPPSTLREGYPPALERIVMRGLEKDPSGRYPTALEMQQELEQLARDAQMTLAPTSLSCLMNRLFPEGQELALTGANPLVTIVDEDDEDDEDDAAATEDSLTRSSFATVPDTSPGTRESPRRSRKFVWMGVTAAGLFTLLGVGALGYARSSLHDGTAPPSTVALASSSAPSAGPSAGPSPDAPSSAEPVGVASSADCVAGGIGADSCGAPKAPRTATKPSRPPKPKTSPKPTWDYDSPLPP